MDKVKPEEVKDIKVIGELFDDEVKMISLKGGLFIAVGKKSNRDKKDMLVAGSHPAIVRHQLETQYKNDFRASFTKSEGGIGDESVKDMTSFLDKNDQDSKYSLFALSKNFTVDLVLCQDNYSMGTIRGTIEKGELKAYSMILRDEADKDTIRLAMIKAFQAQKNG